MLFATDGVVTKVSDIASGDRLINIVTPSRGRISVIVKGSRSADSKTAVLSQLFTYGNFEIYEKGDMYWLRGGMVINPFYELSCDICRMAAATYVCEVANELTDESEECGTLMKLLLNTLYLFTRKEKKIAIVKSAFELRAMSISGYMPTVTECENCGKDISGKTYLDVMGGSVVCEDCFHAGVIKSRRDADYNDVRSASVICPMSASVAYALRYVIVAPAEKVFSFDITDEEELDAFEKISETYVSCHLGRSFDSLSFYHDVK